MRRLLADFDYFAKYVGLFYRTCSAAQDRRPEGRKRKSATGAESFTFRRVVLG